MHFSYIYEKSSFCCLILFFQSRLGLKGKTPGVRYDYGGSQIPKLDIKYSNEIHSSQTFTNEFRDEEIISSNKNWFQIKLWIA